MMPALHAPAGFLPKALVVARAPARAVWGVGILLFVTAGCASTPAAPSVSSGASSAVDFYVAGCNAGDAVACSNAGRALTHPSTKYHDDALALQVRTRACEGEPRFCGDLGAMYLGGKGVAKDEAKALSLYEQACTGGVAADCSRAGALLLGEHEPAEKIAKVAKNAKEAKGDKKANAAIVPVNAKSIPRDEARARTFFEKACKAGEEKACTALAPKPEPKPAVKKAR